jgi:Flp pilus assembly protein TadG
MTPCWRRRRREGAQATLETALVMPIMFAITLGFIGMMLQLRAECEFQSAVNLASQAAVQPALGDPDDSLSDARYAFSHTLDPYGTESGYVTVTQPLTCSGPYLEGEVSARPVVCSAGADVDFSNSVVGVVWFWTIHLSATAQAQPPPYRRCANSSAVDNGQPSC